MIKNNVIPLIYLLICPLYLFSAGSIEETDVPMPEVIYDLPQNLIGEFFLATIGGEYELTIFSNNKYILHFLSPYPSQESFHCGHIIKRDNIYFFLPITMLPRGFIGAGHFSVDGTEIYLNKNTFSFHASDMLWIAIRKEDMPVPGERFASDVTVPMKVSKRRYFFNDQNKETIDFNELRPPYYNGLYHELEITNGMVAITRSSGPNFRFQDMRWEGFLEKTKPEPGALKGTIRFTNGNPYYYIEKGIAFLELYLDTIRVTMPCTNETEEAVRQINSNMRSPVYLVLEF